MKILIVEDDETSAMILQAQMKKHGCEVTIAQNGQSAWSIILSQKIDIVVSDWVMPDLDGLELCRRVRRRPGDYTYFILFSICNTSDENLEVALAAGVDDFINKADGSQAIWIRLKMAERILQYTRHIRQLQELIPSCAYCHRVCDADRWMDLESYVQSHTGSHFSPGICPECFDRLEKKEKAGPEISVKTKPPLKPRNGKA